MGSLLLGIGWLGGGAVWLFTAFYFFSQGDTGLGLVALLFPPADLILPFLISPLLGVIGLGCAVLIFAGSVMKARND